MMHRIVTGIVVLALGLPIGLSPAAAQDQGVFNPRCSSVIQDRAQATFSALCEFGPYAGGKVSRVVFQKDGTNQPPVDATFLPFVGAGKSVATLVVVDRSDKRRTRTVPLGAGDAVRLIEAARPASATYRFGLASILGDRFDVAAPIGASRDDIAKSATAIRPDGGPADGSKGLLDAIRLLGQAPADRHLLVLASDGKAEDKAYGNADVVKAARDAGVTVLTIGYRERTGDGPELPTLKRLAEETGGYYSEPQLPSSRVDDTVVAKFAQFIGSGGTISFPLDRAEPRGRYLINAELDGGRTLAGVYQAEVSQPGTNSARVQPQPTPGPQTPANPVRPAPGPQPTATTPPQVAQQTTPPPTAPQTTQPSTTPPRATSFGRFDEVLASVVSWSVAQWAARPLVIAGTGFGILIVLAVLLGFILHRARRVKVFAWVEMMDGRRTRVPVTGTGVRLGRHSDNDIRFNDKSVHRYHAVLSRDAATGQFVITDLSRDQERSNGVLINGELLHGNTVLANGDTVELGDVKFRFVYA